MQNVQQVQRVFTIATLLRLPDIIHNHVPTDIFAESSPAQQLVVAKRFAEAGRSKIIIAHIFPGIPGYAQSVLSSETRKNILAEAKKKNLRKSHDPPSLRAAPNGLLLDGNPARATLHHATEIEGRPHNMGLPPSPILPTNLLGSTASRVVQNVHCSMIIIRTLKD